MTDVAAPTAIATTPKVAAAKVKKAVKPKKPTTHPKYCDMIAAALNSLKERSGSSRQAILKYITSNYKVGDNAATINAHLKLALKSGVKSGAIKQSKGTHALGSFKVGEAKKAVKKAAKPKAAKPKTAKSPKKKTGAKKPSAKKVAKPKKSAKKPAAKKAKTPKKAKTVKKAKSPKPKKAAKSPKKQSKPKKAKTA